MSSPRPDRLSASQVLSHLGVMVAVAAVIGVVSAGLLIPFAGVAGIGARNVADNIDELPADLKTEALPQRSRIVDGDGNVIATLYDQNRVNVSLTQVSKTMREAIVAIEDYRFYQHGALDLKGTLRALITNQASDGVVQGGSSITQQMVKLTLVQQADTDAERAAATDDTYARKIKELRYAIAFEQNYSKDWILERYLNIAYFGDGAYGIQSAARHYFGKNASRLDLRESALLAGLVKNPTGFDPTRNGGRAKERRNVVLDRMAQLNVISRETAARTKAQGLGLDVQRSSNGCVSSRAPFYCDYIVNYLLRDPSLGKTAKDRQKVLYGGGLLIRTPLDLRMQEAADEAVAARVAPTDNAVGGIAMVEPRTGKVRALAQSRPMGTDRADGQTYLNYTVPKEYGGARGFQGGSTFKLFTLAAALEQGMNPRTIISSPPRITIANSQFRVCGGEPYSNVGVWSPKNSTSSGAMDFYRGTQQSVNTFYAQLEQRTGLCKPFTLAKKMGVKLTAPRGNSDTSPELVPSFTLGIPDISPLESAEAYATVAGRGLHCSSLPVTSISDARGNVLKKYDANCEQVMKQSTADTVNDILRGVIAPGGFGQALALDKPAAGKTGTTQNGQAVWFAGYTPTLATSAMIAGANEFGSPISLVGQTVGGSYVGQASGSGLAGPMWANAMRPIQDLLADRDFVSPQRDEQQFDQQDQGDDQGFAAPAPDQPQDDAQDGTQARPGDRNGNGNGNDNGRGRAQREFDRFVEQWQDAFGGR